MPNTECGTADLALAVRLLHILRAYSWTPGNVEDPAREDSLYPAEWRGRNKRGEMWQAVDVLLNKHPYQPDSAGDANG